LLTSPDAQARTNVCIDADLPAARWSDRSASVLSFLLFTALCPSKIVNAQPVNAQPAPSPSAQASAFQSRIDAAALALRSGDPRFKDSSPESVKRLVEFVSGNMLFVLLHELGHAVITQMGLPVLAVSKMQQTVSLF
jgi:hypothetical protein